MEATHPLVERWQLGSRGRRSFDLLLVIALLVPIAVQALLGVDPWWVLLGIAQITPLCWRRHHAVPVFAAVALASAAQPLVVDMALWSQVAFPIATYSVARFSTGRWAAGALAVGIAGAAVASVDWQYRFDSTIRLSDFVAYFVTICTIVVAAWALGTLGRTRQAYVDALVERAKQIERDAVQQVELAASAERARIARDMHDVVAHGLSVMVVQADGARYAAERDPAVAARTLATISDTGREALSEMRRLLGLLRSGEVTGTRPQPRLADLVTLVEEARAVGTRVEASLPDPMPAVPDGVALTAYRVVQEALNNVRKHAGPTANVCLIVGVSDELEILVEDDGRGAAVADDGRGLGLVGMRERVTLHDGTLEAGPRQGGGFRVTARIPL